MKKIKLMRENKNIYLKLLVRKKRERVPVWTEVCKIHLLYINLGRVKLNYLKYESNDYNKYNINYNKDS